MYERAFIFLSLLKLTDKWSLICYVLLTQHSTHTRRCLNQFHTNCVSVLYISNSIYLWIFVYMLSNKHQALSVKRINFNLNYVYTVPFHSSKFRLPHGMEWGINRNRVFKENNHTHTHSGCPKIERRKMDFLFGEQFLMYVNLRYRKIIVNIKSNGVWYWEKKHMTIHT